MFERISRGWQAAVSSWRVLMMDKELLLFPIFSGAACLAVLASFALPFIVQSELLQQIDGENAQQNPWLIAGGLLFYFCNYFIIVFFNSALVACALIRFSGGNPTVADGFSAAVSRLPQILAWSVVAAFVGWILRMIEERVEFVGRIIVGLIGAGWTIATFFVVPVLVVERKSPLEAIKRSTSIVAKTWGESLVGNVSVSLFVFLLTIPGMLLLLAGLFVGQSGSVAVGILLGVTGFIWIMAMSAVGSALNGILVAALYQYAAQGTVPEAFDADLLAHSFAPKAK